MMKKILLLLTLFLIGGINTSDAATLSASATSSEEPSNITITIIAEAHENETLGSLEVDHNISSLPEFHIYAMEGDGAYGNSDDKDQFEDHGVTISYDNGTWNLVFIDTEEPSAFNLIQNATFYFALRDPEGAYLLGSMYDGNYTCASLVLSNGEGTMEQKTSEECPGYSSKTEVTEKENSSSKKSFSRVKIENNFEVLGNFSGEGASLLVIDGVNYHLDELSPAEELIVRQYLLQKIISILSQIIAMQK